MNAQARYLINLYKGDALVSADYPCDSVEEIAGLMNEWFGRTGEPRVEVRDTLEGVHAEFNEPRTAEQIRKGFSSAAKAFR